MSNEEDAIPRSFVTSFWPYRHHAYSYAIDDWNFLRTPLCHFRRMHRGGDGADSGTRLSPPHSLSFALLLNFQNPMSGVPVSIRLQKEPLTCPQCGSASRIGRSLCLSCLLAQGLRSRVLTPQSQETLEDVLGEVDVRDAEWRIGDYQILEEIGRGGIGVVYRVRHGRHIMALKRILSYHADSRDTVVRFRREAEAAASLTHPNILPVYDVSESDDGPPFFSMKFAAGGSLLDAAPVLRSEPRRAVALMAKVARAVQYAHGQGILHRDLKPGNILLDGRGEPLVSDFGLAKCLEPASNLTRTLTAFGASGYVAPEQVDQGGTLAGKLTPAADIYSLGAILFDLLTARPPFLGEHALKVIQEASEKPAPKLRTLVPSLDRDLETICTKCLERAPSARYRSAGALAEDLERWLEGQPIAARPLSPPARAWRWTRRNPALAGMAALLIGLGLAATAIMWKGSTASPPVTTGIAVLPFESLSDDKEDAIFADGVQDDILTKLAGIRDLRVISHTSVMKYRGKRDIREIGKALGVSHILEGTVSRSRGSARFHLKARLIDAGTGTLLWSEEYDRDLSDLFTVQSELARTVAQRLRAKISTAEKLAVEQPPTTDLIAFDLYNRAKNLLALHLSSGLKANLLQAVDLLNQAVGRDPSFLQAYCQLAYAHEQLYFLGFDHTPARLALAEAAIEGAFRLRPDAGETHLANARILYHGHLDYDGALAELEVAKQTLPNDARIFRMMGYIQRRQGRWQESTQNLERAGSLDPRNTETLQQIALSYGVLRRYSEEKSVLDRALAIEPNDVSTKVALAAVQFHWKADTRSLHQTIDSIGAARAGALSSAADEGLSCAFAEHDAPAAKSVLDAIGDTPLTDYSVHLNRQVIEGVIARMTKNDGNALAIFATARTQQEKKVEAEPNYGPALCVLGLIDAGLGRKEEAIREGRRAVELVPAEKDALVGPTMVKYLAMIAAWIGDKDLACQQLAIAIRPPSTVSYGQLKLLPFWDPLRGDPRFEKIVASLAPKEEAIR
jgi:TolB-like protein/Tfp pilus assembly protein PilF/predicted Ser/Thr protein kinase